MDRLSNDPAFVVREETPTKILVEIDRGFLDDLGKYCVRAPQNCHPDIKPESMAYKAIRAFGSAVLRHRKGTKVVKDRLQNWE